MSDSIHPPPGRVIDGKYRMDSLLGEGAMGTVWLAMHLNLGQRVAVKLISPELADSESVRKRFDAEAKAAAALRSRFVVHIYDSGITDDGTPYLVMEYLTGQSLEDRVEAGGPLTLEYAVQILGQVARGLARAHAMSIVHRDLKPANVFLAQTEDGEEVAKVLDFGVAKVRRDGPDQSATATGTVVGTPLFMSPEQARGLKTVDHRSDLYSLGMVAYWALTGQHAFSGEAFGDLVLAICTQPLPAISDLVPWAPPELDAWFEKACAREPEDRFDSADEMIQALIAASGVDEGALHSVGVVTSSTGARFAMASSPDLSSEIGARPVAAAAAGADTVLAAATASGTRRGAALPGLLKQTWAQVLVGSLVVIVGAAVGAVLMLAGRGTSDPVVADIAATGAPLVQPTPQASVASSPGEEPEPEVVPQPEAPASASASAAATPAEPSAAPAKRAPAARPVYRPARPPRRVKPKKPPSGIDIGF